MTLRRIAASVCSVVALSCSAVASSSEQLAQSQEFEIGDLPKGSLAFPGGSLRIEGMKPAKPEKWRWAIPVEVRYEGLPARRVETGYSSSEIQSLWVSHGKNADADNRPSLLFGRWTGGASCCWGQVYIVPVGDEVRVFELPLLKGEVESYDFPKDEDGDGIVDFLLDDVRFAYSFSSGAGSVMPPMVLSVIDGELEDISERPAFRAMWKEFSDFAWEICSSGATDRNGGCIAYLASAARVGDYPAAVARVAQVAAPSRENYCEDEAGREEDTSDDRSFVDEAECFLTQNGYLTSE